MLKKIFITLLMLSCAPAFACDLDEMIGQMIIVGFNGNNINAKEFKKVLKQIDQNKISGVIFFEDNIKNKIEFLKMTNAIKNSKAKYTPFISIDMEGGKVQRMNSNNGFEDIKTAKEVAKSSTNEAYKEYYKMAKMLKDANINLNFAPCVDLAINKNSIIEKKERSYSDDPEIVTKYASEFIKAHTDNQIITSIKHYPGHGSPKGDTHLGFVDITQTHTEKEIIPFIKTANLTQLQMVMVSHLYNKNIDTIYPASLSNKTIEEHLKPQINFEGIIISDDLDMGAVKDNYTLETIVTKGISAGENILLFSNRKKTNPNLVKDIHKIVKKELKKGTIKVEQIETSYEKIKNIKSLLSN